MNLQIGNRSVGPDQNPFVVAEIGVNHDGSLARALELVDHAAAAGADAVKMQIFRADQLMHGSGLFAAYQREHTDAQNPAEMLRRCELAPLDLCRIVEAIRARGLIPLATPFSVTDLETIEHLGLPAVKIASPDLVNLLLLRRASRLGRPLLLSTGASTMEEIAAAVRWLNEWQLPFALLQCTSSYPTAPADAHLSCIGELEREFHVPIGFSDHTAEQLTGALAVAAGAVIIEKHITYDRNAPGPDHAASADPAQFAQYVRFVRLAQVLKGSANKRVLKCEQEVRRVSRQSLVLRCPIAAGARIQEDDLTAQRPGTGIPPAMLGEVVSRLAKQPLDAGTLLTWDMLTET